MTQTDSDAAAVDKLWRFLGYLSLLQWLVSGVASLAVTFVAVPMMPPGWSQAQRYAAIGLCALLPMVSYLWAVRVWCWHVQRRNRPTVAIHGYGGSLDATVRVTLYGNAAKIWLECRILDNTGPHRWNRAPFTPQWFYEGDAKIVRSQYEGTDAWLEDGKAASIKLAKLDNKGKPWVRQPGAPARDAGQPHAYLPIEIVNDEATVSYEIRAIANPSLQEKCTVKVNITFRLTVGFDVNVEPLS